MFTLRSRHVAVVVHDRRVGSVAVQSFLQARAIAQYFYIFLRARLVRLGGIAVIRCQSLGVRWRLLAS